MDNNLFDDAKPTGLRTIPYVPPANRARFGEGVNKEPRKPTDYNSFMKGLILGIIIGIFAILTSAALVMHIGHLTFNTTK